MTPPFVRFTIRHLMAAVALIAVSLAVYRVVGVVGIVLGTFALCEGSVTWFATHRNRRTAARGLAVSATFAGVSVGLVCIYLLSMGGSAFIFLVAVFVVPLIFGFGTSWAAEATRKEASNRRAPLWAWLTVFALGSLPLTMISTLWPLRMAFLVSRPALNRLADRIAAGETLDRPEWAGLYRIVATRREPQSGNVALIIDDDPAGASGFVRLASRRPGAISGPLANLNFDEFMDGKWRYQNED
jgi:hypothetical protein